MKLEPAATVHKLLGVRPLARRLGVSPGYVGQWSLPRTGKGTGGRIPPHIRDAVLDVAKKLKVKGVTRELVYTEPEELDMGKSQRDKGARHERHVVNLLKAAEVQAHKVPLSGAAEGYPGDVIIDNSAVGKIITQCKSGAQVGTSCRTITTALRSFDVVGVSTKSGQQFVAMTMDEFVRVLHGLHVRPVWFPSVDQKHQIVEKAIAGHDVLIYKPDRQPDRVVVWGDLYDKWTIPKT